MWESVEFDDFRMSLAADSSHPTSWSETGAAPCSRNGYADPRQSFVHKSNWQLYHVASQLCAESRSTTDISGIYLAPCLGDENTGTVRTKQEFRCNYAHLRIWETPITLGSYGTVKPALTLVGFLNSTVSMLPEGKQLEAKGEIMWSQWELFPNTGQLRNMRSENLTLGYP
eukprot:CAMPEP_0178562838 /NCGR_PEP_ID=MMETSP0697-20121206/12742_1 /TAXON_ID=265572 /ORGANISM="Extubocellulus spinifer, Strain CCMP396" /LENGTH=170 /DNA_ID=CAMNT_0020196205 /DNA_START=71 /DNA_END=581 /DNA_ORIENTATION=-